MTDWNGKYTNISGAATTVIKSGSGFLYGIIVNTPVASGSITIYDNTSGSGTKIATITYPATLLSSGPVSVPFYVNFQTGLTVVTAGSGIDVTVVSL